MGYDLLRKNCNSFSDCAIFYLLGKRIPKQFRAMEQMGQSMASMVPDYTPNKAADGFDVEDVCKRIDQRAVWSTPGYTLSGAVIKDGKSNQTAEPAQQLSAAELRAKRLEALERGGKTPQEQNSLGT